MYLETFGDIATTVFHELFMWNRGRVKLIIRVVYFLPLKIKCDNMTSLLCWQ